MKVSIFTDAYYPQPSGVSEYVHHMATTLHARGYEVEIVAPKYPETAEIEFPRTYRIGKVIRFRGNKAEVTLAYGGNLVNEVRKYLCRVQPDVLILNGPFPPNISYWGLKYSEAFNIGVFHTTTFRQYRMLAGVFRKVFGETFRKLHVKVAVSKTARDTFQPYIPGEYHIIPPGIDLQRFSYKKRNPTAYPSILFLGRLDERKGLHILLEAMSTVKQKIPGVKLYVVGKGNVSYYKKLAGRWGVADVVEFKGVAGWYEVPEYYSKAWIYCAPSIGGESFGIVLLEAMAAGVPVVAGRNPGYEQVITDGKNGVLVEPTPKAIGDAIIRLIKDERLRQELSMNGLNFVQRFAWPNICDKFIQLFNTNVGYNR